MDLLTVIMKLAVVLVAIITVAESIRSISYTRRICSCNIMSVDGSLHMLVEPTTTYEAWPSVSCHKARKQCRIRCRQGIKIAVNAMHQRAGPLYKPYIKDGRRLGYDMCVKYGEATKDDGIKIILRSEVEHCSMKDVDPGWDMQLCCGYSPSPDNNKKQLFGWYPKCPLKDTIVFA